MNFLIGPAPSIAAAKNASFGSESKPASNRRNINGVHCHVSTIITVTLASVSSLSQRGVKSNKPRKSFIGPNDSWKNVFQITVIITGVVIIGIKKRTRKNLLNAMSLQTRSASAKPRVYCKKTVVSDKNPRRKNDSQNLLSSVNKRM